MTKSTITQSFSCKPVGLLHHYLKFHLNAMKDVDNKMFTETMLFGLGCGLSFNFEQFDSDAIRMNCINDFLLKDLFGHLNIKAWYKTEPNSANFIQYINKLVIQNQPVITMCNTGNDKFIEVRPILLCGYNNESSMYSVKGAIDENENNIPIEQLVKWCDFKKSEIAVNNFWFEIAIPEKLFPIESAIKWALAKNAQSMLYAPKDNKGILGLNSFKQFFSKFSELDSKAIVDYAEYFKSEINGTKGKHNRDLYADFVSESKNLLKIKSLDSAIECLKNSAAIWNELTNDFDAIAVSKSNESKNLIDSICQKIDKIIELEKLAFTTIEDSIYN